MASEARFAGFTPAALRLLASLERHNDRAWFAPRKERFTREVLEPAQALVADATLALEAAGIPLVGDAKRSLFRLYRDVRFSPDKRPYRAHVAAYLSLDGGRATPGGVYVHVAPTAAFLAVAFYRLEPPLLARWRQNLAQRPRAFENVLRALERSGLELEGPARSEDSLVRMPRGYEAYETSKLAPYFRLRSFVTRRELKTSAVTSPALVRRIVEIATDARPLLEYGWRLL